MDDMDSYIFNAHLRSLLKPADCVAFFRDAIAVHGFDTFACGEIDLQDRDRTVFYILDWPSCWQRFYIGSGMVNRDPSIDALSVRRSPFTWSDLRADRKLAKAGREALDLIAAQGWNEGLVVPLPQGGSRMGVVSMVGHRQVIDPAVIGYLTMISICLHSHARTLVSREGFAIPPVGLTQREIACLRLVARGCSDRSIADELGIAVSTAHEFVEKAKRRLKVKSRPELVAVAVLLGIVDL